MRREISRTLLRSALLGAAIGVVVGGLLVTGCSPSCEDSRTCEVSSENGGAGGDGGSLSEGGAAPGVSACRPGTFVTPSGCRPCGEGTFSASVGQPACEPWSLCRLGDSVAVAGTSTTDVSCRADEWTLQLGTTLADVATSVAVDGDGNVFVAGSVSSSFGDQSHMGSTDAFVTKISPAGEALWTRMLGTSGEESVSGVAVDERGDVYIVGSTTGELFVGQSIGGSDIFVVSYSAEGERRWELAFGSSLSDTPSALAAVDGGVVVAGWTTGTLPASTSSGGTDAFLALVTEEGMLAWTRQFGSGNSDTARAVAVGENGSIAVAGEIAALMDGYDPEGTTAGYVREFDPLGEVVRTAFIDSDGGDILFTIAPRGGDWVVGGRTNGYLGEAKAGGEDAFVAGFSFDRGLDWVEQFGTPAEDRVLELVTTENGTIHVVGWTNGPLDGRLNAGSADAFLRSRDASGDWSRASVWGFAGSDTGRGIVVDRRGNIIVVGTVSGALVEGGFLGETDLLVRRIAGR